jgi:hypothetical protein
VRPRDVPRPLLDLACARAYGVPPDPADDRDSIARALAAVLPEHEKQVRAKAAEPVYARERELLEQVTRLNAADHYAEARGVEVAAYEVRRIADELMRGGR